MKKHLNWTHYDIVLVIKNNTYEDDDCEDDDDLDDDDENVTIKKAERLSRSLLPALSITTAANKVATIW